MLLFVHGFVVALRTRHEGDPEHLAPPSQLVVVQVLLDLPSKFNVCRFAGQASNCLTQLTQVFSAVLISFTLFAECFDCVLHILGSWFVETVEYTGFTKGETLPRFHGLSRT